MWSLLFPGVPHFDSCHIPYLAQGRFLSVEVVLYISSCLYTVQVCGLLSASIRGSLPGSMLGKLGLEFAQNCNTWAYGLAGGFRGAALNAGYSAGLCTQLCEQSEDQLGEPERTNRNIPSFSAWDCPREGEEAKRGPDWGLLVYGFSSVSQTSWAGITKQERFVSLAGVWREGILMWFCEQPMDSRRSRYIQWPSHVMPHGTYKPSDCKSNWHFALIAK